MTSGDILGLSDIYKMVENEQKIREVKGRVKCPSCGTMNENEHLVDFLTCYACGRSIND